MSINFVRLRVAPHAGAWIETWQKGDVKEKLKSRPTRARGLKQTNLLPDLLVGCVAPHAGAWIETHAYGNACHGHGVAPHAGAWIETARAWTRALKVCGRAPRGRVD